MNIRAEKAMKHLKTRTKIFLLSLLALIGIVTVGFISGYSINTLDQNTTSMYEDDYRLAEAVNNIRNEVQRMEKYLLRLILTNDAAENVELVTAIKQTMEKIDQNVAIVQKMKMPQQLKERLGAYAELNKKIAPPFTEAVQLGAQDKNSEAYALYKAQIEPLAKQIEQEVYDYLVMESSKTAKATMEENHNEALSATTLSLVATVVAFGVLALFSFWVARLIVTPLRDVQAATERLASGDFTVQLHNDARDEVGQLAHSVNYMVEQLRDVIVDVREIAHDLTGQATQLSAGAEETSHAAEQISASVQEATHSAETQLSGTTVTVQTLDEMIIAIQKIADAYQTVAESSGEATAQAGTGAKLLSDVIQQMKAIKEGSMLSSQIVSELGKRSSEISTMVSLITDIAEQTNLLALNAAIEAARAGEQGAGFSVVAAEVRKLAEQSKASAESISQLIFTIVQDTERAMKAMEQSVREVNVGEQRVADVEQAFRHIMESIQRSAEMVHEVSAISEEMSASTTEVGRSVNGMQMTTQQTLSNTQEIAAATEEQLASMEEMTAQSVTVADSATRLNQAVARFTV